MSPAEYLTKKGIRFDSRGENLIFNCPFCSPPDTEKKAAMHRETGVFNCMHHNRCGEKGTFWYFQSKMGDEPKMRSYDDFVLAPPKKTYKKPTGLHPKSLSKEHREWLKSRGISDDVMLEFGLRSENGAIAFPFKKDGELVRVKYRTLDKKIWSTQDPEPVLFNRDAIEGPEMIICEGEIDAMAYRMYGHHAASVPSGASDMTWIENEWDWLEQFTKIYISMDMDEAGRRAVEVMAERLGMWRCFNVKLPFKDITECLENDVKSAAIDAAIEQATEFHIQEITRPSDYTSEVIAILTNPEYGKGQSTGIKELDDLVQGWRWGELTVWSGRNGSGKTTYLNQIMLNVVKNHGDRVFISSLEMKPGRLLSSMLRQHGIENNGGDIAAALEALSGGVFLLNRIGKVDIKFLMEVWEFAAKKYGCKHFVLDSLMRISLDRSHKYDEQENIVNELVSFAQKFDCHVHLVAHPRKGQTDDDRPGKVDIAGAGDITNLAHNVIILWRPSDEMLEEMRKSGKKYNSMLFVRKNREFGTEGRIPMFFDNATKKFSVYRESRGEF